MTKNLNSDWALFIAEAAKVFVTKNTDYGSRFMRALVQYQADGGYEAARTIWAWEVEKKLDRCRIWVQRGELLVNSEGVRNSVINLFNYTVQYRIFRWNDTAETDPFKDLTERGFHQMATKIKPDEWLNYLTYSENLIRPDEDDLRGLLLQTMTGVPF